MRGLRLAIILSLTCALGACGKQQSAEQRSATATTPAAALTPDVSKHAPAATASQQQDAGLAPTQPNKIPRPNEDGSETVQETPGDSGSHNGMLAAVAAAMSAATPASAAAASPWQEGVNYTRLVPVQPTSVGPGQVEVLEFFWYGCPHCYAIDPLVESWRKSKPAYISFSRVPVVWSEGHRSTARLFYALESLQKLDQLHSEVFKEIHVNNDPLIASDPNDAAGAERVQAAFLAKYGISEDAFHKADHSFSVETAMQRSDQLMQRYRIEGVPTFIVNGKYVADVRSAGGPERLISLVEDLTAQEHKR